jgi:Fur family ferric uptake transcriptional regulator
MKNLKQLIKKFKQHGYKMTPQRRAIIEIIVGCTSEHPTADQIHERVLERMPDTSLATVYNTLRELVAIDQVYELNFGHGVRRYELSRTEHAHQICLQCDKIVDVPGDFDQLAALFADHDEFQPVRHDVTILGYCAECSKSLDRLPEPEQSQN